MHGTRHHFGGFPKHIGRTLLGVAALTWSVYLLGQGRSMAFSALPVAGFIVLCVGLSKGKKK